MAETFNKILDFPSLNAVTVIHQHSGLEIRQRTIKGFRKFLVLYYIDPARAVVVVINVMYGAQDIERALGQVPFSAIEE